MATISLPTQSSFVLISPLLGLFTLQFCYNLFSVSSNLFSVRFRGFFLFFFRFLFNILICLSCTNSPSTTCRDLKLSIKRRARKEGREKLHYLQIELEFSSAGFCGGRKTGEPGEKNPRSKERTNNKLNPHETASTGIEPGSQRWEAIIHCGTHAPMGHSIQIELRKGTSILEITQFQAPNIALST